MKAMQRIGALIGAMAILAGGDAQAQSKTTYNGPRRVLIIRHAEKTGEKNDVHLSKQGVDRAAVLFRLFEPANDRPDPFFVPDFIFAASNSANSQRPLQTVEPLTMKFNLPIDQTYQSKRSSAMSKIVADGKPPTSEGMFGLRDEIFGKPKYVGKTILMSWRHSSIPELARTLGAKDAPTTWDADSFDRVWLITFDQHGRAAFLDLPQRLLPSDARE